VNRSSRKGRRPSISAVLCAVTALVTFQPASADLSLRHVDRLQTLGVGCYTAVDGRLAWRAGPALEFELVGRNLSDSDHIEFVSTFPTTAPTVAERSVYATVAWSS